MYTIFTFHDYDLVMVVVGAAQKKVFYSLLFGYIVSDDLFTPTGTQLTYPLRNLEKPVT